MTEPVKKTSKRAVPVMHVCGPSREYFYGDPPPPEGCSYFDFMEWQEAQLRKRRRPTKRTPR